MISHSPTVELNLLPCQKGFSWLRVVSSLSTRPTATTTHSNICFIISNSLGLRRWLLLFFFSTLLPAGKRKSSLQEIKTLPPSERWNQPRKMTMSRGRMRWRDSRNPPCRPLFPLIRRAVDLPLSENANIRSLESIWIQRWNPLLLVDSGSSGKIYDFP